MLKARKIGVKSFAISQIFSIILFLVSISFIVSQASIVRAQWWVDDNGNTQHSIDGKNIPNGVRTFATQGEADSYIGPPSGSSNQPPTTTPTGTATSSSQFLDKNGNVIKNPGITSSGTAYSFSDGFPSNAGSYTTTVSGIGKVNGENAAEQTLIFKDSNNINLQKLPSGEYQVTDSTGAHTLSSQQGKLLETQLAKDGAKSYSQYEGPLGTTGGVGYLFSGLLYAAAIAGAIKLIGGLVGLEDGLTNALAISAGVGIFTAQALKSLGPDAFGAASENSFFVANAGWIGLGVGVVLFVLLYKKESAKRITFQCLPWEAPVGGKNCEQCNNDPFRPCSEYRCKSLGQACEIVNKGSKEEKCAWINPKDVNSPTITPWNAVLTKGHSYVSHDTRPPALGTKIIKNGAAGGCLAAFTPLAFGIVTNEPAQCKIDLEHKAKYDEMQYFMDNNNFYIYNHTQTFRLPGPNAINTEAPELKNNGLYDFFIRCRDKNGNENTDEYAVHFCVDPSPDTTAPVIVDTSIVTGSAVRFGVGSIPLDVYVNEPSTCKWSTQDKTYEAMETNMTCATSLTQINARELYTCKTNITGIIDHQDNTYYFRCKDQPSKPEKDRNVNVNSYVFKLRGSQQLNIISVSPNGTISGSTQSVGIDLGVTTDDGSDEGRAICSFSNTNAIGSYIPMFATDSVTHSQRLNLGSGTFTYYFRCVDNGGNAAIANTTFTIKVDTFAPVITRVYHDSANNALKIVTNEDATCGYSLSNCNFNIAEGTALLHVNPSEKTNHFAEWKENAVYYIKCADNYLNQPAPNTCNLIASATSVK